MKKFTRVFAVLLAVMVLFTAFPIQTEAATVKLNKTKTTIYVGKTTTLKIKGTSKKVTWSSSNKKVATVTTKGKVTAKKAGTTTITAKVGKKSYKCKVTVKKPYINVTKKTLGKGTSYTLKLTGTEIKSVKSSNTKVATVTKKGKVTAKEVGKATITLKGKNGKTYTCKITVNNPYISKKSKVLLKKETYTLKLIGTKIKSAKSSNTKVATVTKKGKVTAKAIGETTITLKGEDNKNYTCKIVVKKKHSTTNISWNGGDITLGSIGISVPTLEDFNNVALVPGAGNEWTGVVNTDKKALFDMNIIYMNTEEFSRALEKQGVSANSVNGFTVYSGAIAWSWNTAESEAFKLERDRQNGYYKLIINMSLKDCPYGQHNLADWNKDIVKYLCTIVSSEPETLYNMIYEDIHGTICISDSGWTTVGDCQVHYDNPNSYKNHYVYWIKAK